MTWLQRQACARDGGYWENTAGRAQPSLLIREEEHQTETLHEALPRGPVRTPRLPRLRALQRHPLPWHKPTRPAGPRQLLPSPRLHPLSHPSPAAPRPCHTHSHGTPVPLLCPQGPALNSLQGGFLLEFEGPAQTSPSQTLGKEPLSVSGFHFHRSLK